MFLKSRDTIPSSAQFFCEQTLCHKDRIHNTQRCSCQNSQNRNHNKEVQWLVLFSQCHIPPQPPNHSPASATHRRTHQQADQRSQAGVQISVKGPDARHFSLYFLSFSISSFRQTLNCLGEQGYKIKKAFPGLKSSVSGAWMLKLTSGTHFHCLHNFMV